MPLSPVAQAESTKTFFLAQTLESTRTVPMVSAELPVNGDSTDEVVGSFAYRGITYAVEPGGESVAVVAFDRAKSPQSFFDAQAVVLPSEVSPEGAGPYRVTRIANGAFAGLAMSGQEELQSERNDEGPCSDETSEEGANTEAPTGEGAYAPIVALTVPASVVSIEEGAFAGAETLQRVIVSADNPAYAMYDSCLYDKSLTSLLLIPGGRLGAVRVASQTASFPTVALSHCAATELVVDVGSTAFQTLSGIDLHNGRGETVALTSPENGAGSTELAAFSDYSMTLAAEGSFEEQVIEGAVAARESMRIVASNGTASIEGADRLHASTDVAEYEVLLHDSETNALRAIHVVASEAVANETVDDGLGSALGGAESLQPEPDRAATPEEGVVEGGSLDDGSSFDVDAEWREGAPDDASSVEDDAARSASVPFAADLITSDGVYMINRVAELTSSEAVPYAAPNPGSAQIFGRSYRDAFLVVDSGGTMNAFLVATRDQSKGGFTGTASWTGGDERGPDKNSVVTVNVGKYMPADGNPVSTLDTFYGHKAPLWGATSKNKLVGFRNIDTGSFLSLETIYSGESFSFSYKMGEIYLPQEDDFNGNALTDYGVCHRAMTGDTGFRPVFEEDGKTVAVKYDPKGGVFSNGATGQSSGTIAMTYSEVGKYLNTPTSPISKEEVVVNETGEPVLDDEGNQVMKPMTFIVWFYKDNSGNEVPAPATAPASQPTNGAIYGTTYYAKWASSTNEKRYEDAFLVVDAEARIDAFLVALANQPQGGFTGTVSWTGGDDVGPDANSIVTVNVEKYVATQGNQVATLETLYGTKAVKWGADSKNKLVGFRNIDTGSFLSLETIYSGESFSFSYKMGEIYLPQEEDDYNGNALTDYGVCHRAGKGHTGFVPMFEQDANAVAVKFDPNGGRFINGVTGHYCSNIGMTYSEVGKYLNTPTSPISKEEVVVNETGEPVLDDEGNQVMKPMTFIGWFYKDNSGNEVPAPATAPASQPTNGAIYGTTYYAKWASSTNEWHYENADLVVDSGTLVDAFLVAFGKGERSGFTGTVTWTGGDEQGPDADSVVTVNVQKYLPADANPVATLDTFYGNKAPNWGATSRNKLLGFRNVDTGSFLSLETIYSGKPFTFSYRMGEVVPCQDESGYNANILLERGVYHRAVEAQDTGFRPVFQGAVDTVAVKFHPNGGVFRNGVTGQASGAMAMTYSQVGKNLNTPASPISNGTKTFLGWFEANADGSFKLDSGGNKILASGVAPAQPANGSISPVIYKADWADSTITWYTISYDKNAEAAVGETHPTYMYLHGPSYLADNGFANAGYTFVEWNTEPDGSGISFAADTEAVKEDFVGETIHAGDELTLYAVWKAHEYTVVFEKGEGKSGLIEGKAEPAPIACTYDRTEGAPAALAVSDHFERKGYSAAAWQVVTVSVPAPSEDEDDEVHEVVDGAIVAVGDPIVNLTDIDGAVVTLVPCWTLDDYAILIDKNDGSYIATFPAGSPAESYQFVEEPSEGADHKIVIPAPKRAGYAFAGWERTDASGAAQQTDEIDPVKEVGDMTFKAMWTPVLSVDLPIETSSSAAFAIDAATGRTQDQLEGAGEGQTVRIKSANAVDTYLAVRSERIAETDLASLFEPRDANTTPDDIDAFVDTVGFSFAPVAGGNLLPTEEKTTLSLLHENDHDSALVIRGSEALLEEDATELRYIDADGVLALACRTPDGSFAPFWADPAKLSIATGAAPFDFARLIWTVSLGS